jgi:hypothetical protein
MPWSKISAELGHIQLVLSVYVKGQPVHEAPAFVRGPRKGQTTWVLTKYKVNKIRVEKHALELHSYI